MGQQMQTLMSRVLPAPQTPSMIQSNLVPRAAMPLEQRVMLGRERQPGEGRGWRIAPPLTILEMRAGDGTPIETRCERPPIFTTEFVKTLNSTCVAKLLNDCYYDLVKLEQAASSIEQR